MADNNLGGSTLENGIEKLGDVIKNLLGSARKPSSPLPPFYTTIESNFRPGLSAISLTANILSRLGEGGADASLLPDGSEPLMTKFIRILNEEMVKELQLNMKGMTEIPPGTLMGMAGPVPVIATTPVQGGSINL